MRFRYNAGAVILIVLGVFFLLSNLGLLPGLGVLLRDWWPLVLIVVGFLLLIRPRA